MKKLSILQSICLPLILALTISSCASYEAVALNNLSPDIYVSKSQNYGGVRIAAKAFNKIECKKYLDRDVISKGYQPIQLSIENNSNDNYYFSLSRISLPCARPEEVAEKVHTSTVGRATGYGAAALLTCGLFAIPAIVDGVKSSHANEALDSDFICKAAKDQTIYPYSHTNMLIFVPVNGFQSNFAITLIDEASSQPKVFHIIANG